MSPHKTIVSRLVKSAGLVAPCFLWFPSAQGNVIYDESASADLSNSGLTPTVLTVGVGENIVYGATGRGANGIDRDYFTVTVPSGFILSAIVVLPGTTIAGAGAFIGIEAGTQITLPTNASSAAGLLGWQHYTDTPGDILPALSGSSRGASGFNLPLGSGSYAFWVQEFGSGSYTYGFNFQLTPVQATVPDAGPGLVGCAAISTLLICFYRMIPLSKQTAFRLGQSARQQCGTKVLNRTRLQ